MDKNARRKIISEKSEYVRKHKKWTIKDEFQFRWLMHKLKKEHSFYYFGVSSRVRVMLEKHGYKVTHIVEDEWWIRKEE